jgi:hypothetical protein
MPINMADVAKRPGAARQAAAVRDAGNREAGNRPAVTLIAEPRSVRGVYSYSVTWRLAGEIPRKHRCTQS